MTTVGPWPIYPMGERMKEIDDELPVTILYGAGKYFIFLNLNLKLWKF